EMLDSLPNIDGKNIANLPKENFKVFASKLASFVNPDRNIAWSLGVLVTAFKHMVSVVDVTIENFKLPLDLLCGVKTQDLPLAYNACMLYRICRVFAIKTRPSMPFEEMA